MCGGYFLGGSHFSLCVGGFSVVKRNESYLFLGSSTPRYEGSLRKWPFFALMFTIIAANSNRN